MNLKTKMEKVIINGYKNIGGIIVLKDGKVEYENYLNQCTSTSTLHIYSVTKSILSILFGIAIDQGYIKSLDQRVLEFFPDYKGTQGDRTIEKISLKHLLTMTAPYHYHKEPYVEYFNSDNHLNFTLAQLGGKGELGKFLYAAIVGPDILSGILVKATGQPVLRYARENLFNPLGITVKDEIILPDKEAHMAFVEAKDRSGWVTDDTGLQMGGWGLTLTAMDMAKIGQLYLDCGVWDDKRIVSSNWIRKSTTGYSEYEKLMYGYLWWIIDEDERCYAAMGDMGNIIYINEKKRMVVSIASLNMQNARDRIKLIREYMEPAFYGK